MNKHYELMSRSRKKPIVKDKTGHTWYNRIVRRRQRQQVKGIISLKDVLEYNVSQPKELVNDYDVCEYKLDYTAEYWRSKLPPLELKKLCCK